MKRFDRHYDDRRPNSEAYEPPHIAHHNHDFC
jgi:hypothetical protein